MKDLNKTIFYQIENMHLFYTVSIYKQHDSAEYSLFLFLQSF